MTRVKPGLLLCLAAGLALCSAPAPARAEVPPAPASAATPGLQAPPPPALSEDKLRRSIDDVLRRPEFSWRAPRPGDGAAAGNAARPAGGWLRAAWRRFSAWLDRLFERAREEREARREAAPAQGPSAFGTLTLRGAMIALGAALAAGLAWLGIAQWRARRGAAPIPPAPPPAGSAVPPDLTDENLLASQRPEDEWRRAGEALLARGERRLALRAFYLAALAGLDARGWLTVARHKSNRDYVGEVRRRARGGGDPGGAFARAVGGFERVWYGAHPADDGVLAEVRGGGGEMTNDE